MKQCIYADNAATTKLDKAAYEAMIPWLVSEYGNASQPYAFSRKPRKALSEAREIIANCIGAQSNEVYFTSGGTESDNWVIKGTAFFGKQSQKIVTSSFEHHAILNSCATLRALGYSVEYVKPTESGYITPNALEKCIDENTNLVSIMFSNNEIGSIQPIKELCALAHKKGAMFHTDAVQAVGHIKIDVKELDIDFLSASAHKFNGPKGIGFLYIRNGIDIHPYIDGGSQELGHRAGTENVASIVGMATALKKNCECLDGNICHSNELVRVILEKLNRTGIVYRRNGGDNTMPGLLSLSFPNRDGEAILHRMDLNGICISTGSACDSKNTHISHVLRAINLDETLSKGTIRISLNKDNTFEEAERIADAIIRVIND